MNEPITTFAFLFIGLLLLTVGAEALVRGASALATAVRISPLVIGLTVVGYGTSMPELVVSVQSSLQGQSDIAIGNVVGSNIFNVLFILGLSAIIIPLKVSRKLIRFDVPLMFGLSLLLMALAVDGSLGRFDGLLFILGLISYTVWGIMQSRREHSSTENETGINSASTPVVIWRNILLVLAGLLLLIFGSRAFTHSAIALARELQISEFLIGVTIVAAGTSLPEVATSIMAAFRGERDIAVGNVVGSNIFNILGVVGLSSLLSPEGAAVSQTALWFDLPVMAVVALACLPIFLTNHTIDRWEGGLFVVYYAAYTGYLILAETSWHMIRTFEQAMLVFVIPLTLFTVIITLIRHLRSA